MCSCTLTLFGKFLMSIFKEFHLSSTFLLQQQARQTLQLIQSRVQHLHGRLQREPENAQRVCFDLNSRKHINLKFVTFDVTHVSKYSVLFSLHHHPSIHILFDVFYFSSECHEAIWRRARLSAGAAHVRGSADHPVSVDQSAQSAAGSGTRGE